MTSSKVKDFYSGYVQKEWKRLDRDPYHSLELSTTLRFLDQYLPKTGLILDAGGGPGRYTLELAQKGYEVVLLDLTPANLEFARRKIKRSGLQERVRQVVEGSIVDLSQFADNTFDAVISTGGPLSHVIDAAERKKAIAEFMRVAKPGAPIFVSVMGRLSVLATTLQISAYEIELPHFAQLRDTGDYMGDHGFTVCHFFTPEELREDFSIPGLSVRAMAGLEGISSNHRKELNQLAKNENRWKNWLETHYQTCTHPAIVGTSEHMLIIAQKI